MELVLILLYKEEFLELSEINQVAYINDVTFDRNKHKAIIINDNHYYDADNNEKINNIVEYAENLNKNGCKLFA